MDLLHSSNNPLGHALALSLNVHPQSGLGPCQANYRAFCEEYGVNPANDAALGCNMTSHRWTKALFDTMLDPSGIDWWWTDSEGCLAPNTAMIDLPSFQADKYSTSLIWSNYVYSSMIAKTGKRPLVLSRYGGVGNQLYGIGFSGDTESAWPTLKYQVEMTSIAANVLQAYWSHDIGGYNVYCPANPGVITPCSSGKVEVSCNITLGTCKRADGELYTRWLQFGAVSPILRTHCAHCDRRIWVYPAAQFAAMKAAMLFRNALVPYLYTAARFAYDHAVAPVHPLYYDWDLPEAYQYAAAQYLLGETLMAAPITVTATNYTAKATHHTATATACTPGKYLGCFDDHPPKLEQRNTGPNSPSLTVEMCASSCDPGTETHIAIDSGGLPGHPGAGTSQCWCGSNSPPASRALPASSCNAGCSGNKSQSCGGNFAGSVYTLVCPPPPPPPPPPPVAPGSPAVAVWIPPGMWYPWNTSAAQGPISMPIAGPVVLRGLRYGLGELPLFALAGSVVPTQTMQRDSGPLVWTVFPGNGTPGVFPGNGTGSHYEDDGVSTQYQQAPGSGGGFSKTTLSHHTAAGSMQHTAIISGQSAAKPPRRQLLQLRRVAGSHGPPTSVICDGAALPELPPPPAGAPLGAATGWWVAPAAEDSLWLAGGSLMVSLPLSSSNISVTMVY